LLIHVLSGPNLNLLGTREPEIYGIRTLADVEAECHRAAARHRLEILFRQTNAEHVMIEWLQEARGSAGIVIEPSAFCYHSLPIVDALKMCPCPVIEIHISNIHRREPWRAQSLISGVSTALLTGVGTHGYVLALEHLAHLLREAPSHGN
jgi:3-dehydroquinate dehydratase II